MSTGWLDHFAVQFPQKMDTLPDLSWYYDFRFDSTITVDSVVYLLSTVDGLVNYGGVQIPVIDIIDD